MKNLIGLVFGILFFQIGFAQEPQFAVVRPDGTTFICPSWDSAYKKANSGDKIFIPKGTFNTSSTPINKTLHLIGVGINDDSATTTGVTIFDAIDLYTFSSNSIIENVRINGSIIGHGLSSGDTIKNIQIKNFDIRGSIRYYGASNSIIFEGMSVTNSTILVIEAFIQNSIISNCIILREVYLYGKNNLFSNNIFFFHNLNVSWRMPSYSIIRNNIFLQSYSSQFSTITNNGGGICLNASENIYFQNINENFSQLFLNPGNSGFGGSYFYNSNNNYKIKSTSMGKGAGTDGTDIGIYGGAFPWDDSGQYRTPVIYHKKVGPNSTNDGKLKVEYKVRAGN